MNTQYILSGLVVVTVVGVLFTYTTTHAPEEMVPTPEEKVTGEIESTDGVPVRDDRTIELRNSGLTSVPGYVFDKKDTEALFLSGNILTGSLPAEVRHLQELKVLDLSNNNFTGVPAEVGQLQKLEVLNLSGNPITGLPLEIGNLQNLKMLDLRGTQYSKYDLRILLKSLPGGVEILME
jgi:hypothetical protein